MLRNLLYNLGSFGRVPFLSRWWIELRFHWHASRKGAWLIMCALGAVAVGFGYLVQAMLVQQARVRDITCLARNVYYEARGEPAAGRFAVAQVTMNRVASPYYPDSVCEVVYQKNWDYLRGRYVSAFSWTEFDFTPHPEEDLWRDAWATAEAVYDGHRTKVLKDALHYHASYIKPSWARGKRPIARIGGHIFYR